MPRARRTEPHLWKHANGVRYIVWQEDGKTRMRSTGTKKVAAAESELRAFREDWERRRWGRQEEAPISRAVDEWVAEKEKPRWGLASSTLNQYRSVARRLKAFLPDRLLASEVSPRDLRRFLDHLETDYGLTPQGLRKRVGILSMMFEWLAKEGLVGRNPAKALDVPRDEPEPIGELPEPRFRDLLQSLEEERDAATTEQRSRNSQMLHDYLQVLWLSGMRSIEALRLTWEDIDLRRKAWTIRSPRNKGGTRTVPMHEALVPILKRRKLLRDAGLFPAETLVRQAWNRFKGRHPEHADVHLHGLRYAFVSRMERLGSQAAARFLAGEGARGGERTPTSELVGHGSAKMTAHYTQWQAEDLRALINALDSSPGTC